MLMTICDETKADRSAGRDSKPAKARRKHSSVVHSSLLKPVDVWRGRVEQDLARAVISLSRPVAIDDDSWQHPLPEAKQIRLQQVRRAHLGTMGRVARQHCWW